MNNEIKAQIEKDAEEYAKRVTNPRIAKIDFKAGAISQNNKVIERLQGMCGHDDRFVVTAEYLESLKI